MPDSTTAAHVHGLGYEEGLARGRLELACRQMNKLLRGLGRRFFGEPDASSEACLERLEKHLEREGFEELARRFPRTTSWPAWTEGLAPSRPVPPVPAYVAQYEFTPDPPAAGFDQNFKVSLGGPPSKASGTKKKAAAMPGLNMVIHMRFQKWHEPDLDQKIYKANRKLRDQYRGSRVESILFLLFANADGPGITGRFKDSARDTGSGSATFEYKIARVWEKSPEEYLNGGLGVSMLAPLSNVTEDRLPEVIAKMEEGVKRQAKSAEDARMVWSAAYWYMGLRYPADLVNRLLANELPLLREDKTYQSIQATGFVDGRAKGEEEGRIESTRAVIRLIEEGASTAATPARQPALDEISDLAALEHLVAEAARAARKAEEQPG